MGRKPNQRPPQKQNGSPKEKEINWDLVDKLLEAGCLGTEIAPHFAIHQETLYDRCFKKYGMMWTDYSQKMKQKGDSSLRAKQYQKAMSGDNTLLVWLGKTRLKQRDTDDKEISLQDATIETTLERAKLKAENAELRKIINDLHESKTGNVDLQSEQTPEHLVRGSSIGEDLQ